MNYLFGSTYKTALLSLALTGTAYSSVDSISEIGINSRNVPYTGMGISIGQVELDRPADPDIDNASNSNFFTDPEQVYLLDDRVEPTPNSMAELFDNQTPPTPHATRVAGVMISADAFAPGVARNADLYASHGSFVTNPFIADSLEVTSQFIATRDNGDVPAINMSFAVPFDSNEMGAANGDSKLTQFIDWSARIHDVLYVTALRNNTTLAGLGQPFDEFNGMTAVASMKEIDGTYRRVATFADFSVDAEGDRVSVDIMAPGANIDVVAFGGGLPPVANGSSFAAPHVTGTVALLQEHAEKQIMDIGAPRWTANARKHEVMKAVLMNSADKLIDNGMVEVNDVPVPQGGLLGMSRTALDQDGLDWLQSEAYDDSIEGFGPAIPLDDQMGAGHLNATRALQQFIPGEYASDSGNVPTIGWDYGTTTGENDTNKYPLAGNLLANHFISVTLAWDRHVTFLNEGATAGVFENGDTSTTLRQSLRRRPVTTSSII
jgi:subtilisin family serine protease